MSSGFSTRRAERLAAHRVYTMPLIAHRREKEEVAFVPEIADLLRDEQHIERDTAIPEASPLVRVRDEAGVELWMAPHPPPPLLNVPPELPRKYRSHEFYRNGLILCAVSLMCVTIFQVYVFILSRYYWPLHFFALTLDKEAFEGAYTFLVNYLALVLGVHPLIMGSWILAGTFCFRKKVLKQFFTRSLYFCTLNAVYTVLSILFVTQLQSNQLDSILKDSMDLYNFNVTHLQRVRVPTNEPWDRLQNHQQCCGIRSPSEWILQKGKVPQSCCQVFKFNFLDGVAPIPVGYKEDLEECILSPTPGNSWQDGCVTQLIHFLSKFCAAFAFLQILIIMLVATSSFFALKFFIVVQHATGNPDFDYTLTETCIHIWCLGPCIKYERDKDTGEYVMIGKHIPQRLRGFTRRLTGLFGFGKKKNLLGQDISTHSSEIQTAPGVVASTERNENTENGKNAENSEIGKNVENAENGTNAGNPENGKNAENDEKSVGND